jgi:hypothetical protein
MGLTLVIRFGRVVLVREPAVIDQYAEPHQYMANPLIDLFPI